VSLMATHILDARSHPLFFGGQNYGGTIKPHLVAAAFFLFGATPAVFRVTMSFFLRCISRGSEHSYGAFSAAVLPWRPAPGSHCRRSFSHSRASRPTGFTR